MVQPAITGLHPTPYTPYTLSYVCIMCVALFSPYILNTGYIHKHHGSAGGGEGATHST